MMIDKIFDGTKTMTKIKFDVETASDPSSLNTNDIEMDDIADSLYEYTQKKRVETTRSEDDEEMKVMRPVESFFDRTKSMTISIGTIIEYQEKIFEDYCNKFVITEIKDGLPSPIIRIRNINHDGTLGQDCWVNYDSNIIEVLSEEQFVTLGKIAIDKQIEDCVEKLKLIRATIRDHKKSKNHIKENLQKSLSQYRQNSTSKV